MLLKQLSLVSALVALSSVVNAAAIASSKAATSTTSAAAAATSAAVPAAIIPLPAFNGTFTGSYPTTFKVAPTNTALVTKWMAELNMTAVPTFPVVKVTSGGDVVSPNSVSADACDWTINNCINNDIITCPAGVWGLTYDDGPTEFSETLYNFLDETDQKATLFYIGSNVITNWEATRRACGAGHQIAVHTWSHQMSTSLTDEQFVAEVKYTEMAIKELCGFTPRYFRPPYGDIDNRIRGLLTQMGYTSVIWDLDTDDWEMDPSSTQTKVTQTSIAALFDSWVAKEPTDTTGHVCLEHELYQSTVDAAITNLPKLQKTWKTMPVSACMNDPHPYQEKNITLATMNGTVAGVSNSNSNGTSTGTNSTGTDAASSSGSGKNGSSSASTVGMTSAAAAVVAAVIAASQFLL